jgi:hypothetical protein
MMEHVEVVVQADIQVQVVQVANTKLILEMVLLGLVVAVVAVVQPEICQALHILVALAAAQAYLEQAVTGLLALEPRQPMVVLVAVGLVELQEQTTIQELVLQILADRTAVAAKALFKLGQSPPHTVDQVAEALLELCGPGLGHKM